MDNATDFSHVGTCPDVGQTCHFWSLTKQYYVKYILAVPNWEGEYGTFKDKKTKDKERIKTAEYSGAFEVLSLAKSHTWKKQRHKKWIPGKLLREQMSIWRSTRVRLFKRADRRALLQLKWWLFNVAWQCSDCLLPFHCTKSYAESFVMFCGIKRSGASGRWRKAAGSSRVCSIGALCFFASNTSKYKLLVRSHTSEPKGMANPPLEAGTNLTMLIASVKLHDIKFEPAMHSPPALSEIVIKWRWKATVNFLVL